MPAEEPHNITRPEGKMTLRCALDQTLYSQRLLFLELVLFLEFFLKLSFFLGKFLG